MQKTSGRMPSAAGGDCRWGLQAKGHTEREAQPGGDALGAAEWSTWAGVTWVCGPVFHQRTAGRTENISL